MARDILSEYGRDSGAPQRPSASHGGCMPVKDVRNYSPPQGPKGMSHVGPGLGGHNCGTTNKPTGCDGGSGSPGLHGQNKGNEGSQR